MVKQPDTDFPLKGFELYRLEGIWPTAEHG